MISDWASGHLGPRARINVRDSIRELRQDPLLPLMAALGGADVRILEDDISRYMEAYDFYSCSVARYLEEMSVAVRWSRGPYFARKYGEKYTEPERVLAARYNMISRYLRVDFFNCLIHARVVLDRVVALSKRFIVGQECPSFSSFNRHRRFFLNGAATCGSHDEYARYFREETDWFEMPLKIVRDKYLVHDGPRHIRAFGYSGAELGLQIIVPQDPRSDRPLGSVNAILVSIPQLMREMRAFLVWYNDYALRAISRL